MFKYSLGWVSSMPIRTLYAKNNQQSGSYRGKGEASSDCTDIGVITASLTRYCKMLL